MNADPYSPEVRRLFAAPAHAGTLDDAVVVSHDAQGIRIELSALAAGDLLGRLAFRAFGCPHVIAAAEAFCSAFEGRPAGDLGLFRAADAMDSLGVPAEKTGRILVLEDTVRMLENALRARTSATDD